MRNKLTALVVSAVLPAAGACSSGPSSSGFDSSSGSSGGGSSSGGSGSSSSSGGGSSSGNDVDGSIWARYNVPWQPAYVFYRADGSSTFVNNPTSAMSQQELSGRVAALTS